MRVDSEIRTQYSDESDACYAARMLWYDFKDAVFYENRYFVKHELLDMLAEYISENILDIEAGYIYYRARIIDDSCIDEHMIRKCYSFIKMLFLEPSFSATPSSNLDSFAPSSYEKFPAFFKISIASLYSSLYNET